MKDRIVEYPNRYAIIPREGGLYDLEPRPGAVIEEGTPLNKATLLSDSTAAELGIKINNIPDPNATVDQALNAINGSKASEITYTATIFANWNTHSGGGYAITVPVPGITSSDNPIVDVVLGQTVSESQKILEAWSCVSRIVTVTNGITAYAYEDKPEVNIPIQLKVVR